MTMQIKDVSLEMSLKPFKQVDDAYIDQVCREAFIQWLPLIRDAEQVSVMFWTADGSEILDYRGDMDSPIEWARYIGSANPHWTVSGDPDKISIHSRSYLYRDNPAVITFGTLGKIVKRMREIGKEITGLPVRIGATFDPGCEFAKSPFKYDRHREICMANTGGPKSFACCYATLNADDVAYRAFPKGITQDMPLGTFIGGQTQAFMTDLGFDYVWFSNGFGFGLETWMTRGPLFDGQTFDASLARPTRDKIIAFWKYFREQCPDFRVETRGTNLSTGIDLASDAVPLRDLYDGDFNFLPPPNSPWAALNYDFGLELVGYMSHIAEIPGDNNYPFRFYTHDAWWKNSPWLDRYEREPYDIYMPMSVSRINHQGKVENPSSIHFLSIDDSFGNMPVQVPNEVIPHIQEGVRRAPDQAGPVVWVYPFDEYHALAFGDNPRLDELFFGDWFIRSAITNGLPLNTVMSSTAFVKTQSQHGKILNGSVLVLPVPDGDTELESGVLNFVSAGGKVILYGPTRRASKKLLDVLGLKPAKGISGEMQIAISQPLDVLSEGTYPSRVIHRPHMCGGDCEETYHGDKADLLAQVTQENETRAAAVIKRIKNGGQLVWVRGTVSADYLGGDLISGIGHLPTADDAATIFAGDTLMRQALAQLGEHYTFAKRSPSQKNPVTCVSRNNNGLYYSGYVPDMTVELRLKSAAGAPLMLGWDTEIKDGYACYRTSRSWRRECRVFIEQTDGVVTCREMTAERMGITRRLRIHGLKNARVRFYPERSDKDETLSIVNNGSYPYIEGPHVKYTRKSDALGDYIDMENLSGELVIGY